MDRQERNALLQRLQADAGRIAGHFGLEYRDISAEHPRVKSRYGVCYQDGRIKIRLNHAKTGQPLKYSSLIDTLCHELAHLRHFNHGPEFKDFFFEILGWARRQGIYQPGPRPGRKRVPRDRSRSLALSPAAAEPPRRNGVAVFTSREPERPLELPWLTMNEPKTRTGEAVSASREPERAPELPWLTTNEPKTRTGEDAAMGAPSAGSTPTAARPAPTPRGLKGT